MVNPETHCFHTAGLLDLPVPKVLGVQMPTAAYNLYMGARDPNTDRHARTAGILSTELCPQDIVEGF